MKQKSIRFLLWLLFYLTLVGFTNNLFAQYCIPTSTYGPFYNTLIDGVELNNLSNTGTGAPVYQNYYDYTSQIAVLNTSSQNELIITAGSYYVNMLYYAWIDYNRDSDFNDAGELLSVVQPSSAGGRMSILFTIPDGTLLESTRLRVTCVYNVSNLDPCSDYIYGETEDYTVEIIEGFYEQEDISLINVINSSVSWGDYNNDGDLDLLITGDSGSGRISKIYKNDNGNFSELMGTPFEEVDNGSVQWGDCDNDGDLDILLTGNRRAFIYINNNGSFGRLSEVNLELVDNSSVDWGDYNNDGNLDILLTGSDGTSNYSLVYKNNGDNTFTEQTNISLEPVDNGSAQWGDCDNDGDLDILLTGDNNGADITRIYENINGEFTLLNGTPFVGVSTSSVAWGDYDSDGDLDILLTGNDGGTDVTKIYKNTNGVFSEVTGLSITNVSESSVAWGDYDNDGDLDFIITGNDSGNESAEIYENFGSDNFENTGILLDGVRNSSVSWIDYDNDGDLDVLITGSDESSNELTKLYRNDIETSNTLPTSPSNLNYSINADTVILSWDAAADNETAEAGLTYNVYVKDEAGNYVVSPHTVGTTSVRTVVDMGNAQTGTDFKLKLHCGSYTWSVQAIDNNFAGGNFATEASFYIPLNVPADLDAQNIELLSAELHWIPGSANSWSIEYGAEDFTQGSGTTINNVTAIPYLLDNLLPETSYDFYIKAFCSDGVESDWVGPYSFTTLSCVNPSNLSASVGYTSASLNWTPGNASHWDLSYGLNTLTNPEEGTIIYDASKPYVLSDLNTSTSYKFWVRDTCYYGLTSDWVGPFTFTTKTVLPPSSISISNITSTTVDLSWIVGSCAGYNIVYGPAGFELSEAYQINTTTNTTTLIGLTPMFNYEMFIRDSCGINATSNWVGPFSFNTSDLFTVADIDTLPDIYGTLSWVNLDDDSDLDVVVYGKMISGMFSFDITGSCEYYASGLYGSYKYAPKGSFIDYNGDNYVDLLSFGDRISSEAIYTNNQDFTFTSNFGEWNNFNVASTSLADYDADGDLDIFVTGTYLQTGLPGYTTILINDDAGNFSDAGIDFLGLEGGGIKTTDFNNDGYIDFINTGTDINNNVNTILYKSDGNGNFEIVPAGIIKLKMGAIEWGDYNNDGLVDLIIAGRTSYSTEYRLYKNLGNDEFEDVGLELDNSLEYTYFKWADLNSDGYLDIVAIGKKNINDNYSKIFFNNKDDSFSQYNIAYGSISLGDYDLDGDLDLIRSFGDNTYANTDIYVNNSTTVNSNPSTPQNLNSVVLSNYVELSWDKASDDLTETDGLTYNLRIGTSSNSSDIISPLSNLTTGVSKYYKLGNKLHVNSCTIKDLEVGDYYWSVQTIDNAGNASAFSAEQTFSILPYFEVIDTVFLYDGWQKIKWCKGLSSVNSLDIMSIGIKKVYVGSPFPMPELNSNTVLTTQVGDDFVSGLYTPLENISYGDFDFADANSDGKIDILLTGAIYDYYGGIEGDTISKLYTVDYMSGAIDQNVDIPYLKNSSVDWGDYNNDGMLDFIISGKSGENDVTKVYKNIGNLNFEEDISLNIQNVSNGSCQWVDLNNDTYLDLFICGEVDGSPKTLIYKNNKVGGFELRPGSVENLSFSSVDFADYDKDGDLDILIAGVDIDRNSFTSVYENLGDFHFEDQKLDIRKISQGNVKWMDYDNDGLLDISLIGTSGLPLLGIYKNLGDNVFSEFETDIDPGWFNTAAWFDYDSDGDLDLACGKQIFKNNNNWSNNKPLAPTGLYSERNGYGIKLEWEPAIDDITNSKSLSYNVRIGAYSNGNDVVNPLSNISTGEVSVTELGNCQLNTKFNLDSLPEGNYYWSVQAIDQGFKGSQWALEQTFTITVIRADFYTDTVCKGEITHFTDTSLTGSTEITAWEWDFGDDSTSTAPNPTHKYAASGNYQVQLIAIGGDYSDTITKTVRVKPLPIAGFKCDPVCNGTLSVFENTSNIDSVANVSWYWDLGDGNTSSDSIPANHSYSIGIREVELIALADNECSDTIVQQVQVAEIPDVSISVSRDLDFCLGDSAILYVGDSSKVNYTYEWLKDGNNFGAQDAFILKATEEAEYSVRIENTIASCVDTSDVKNVIVYDEPLAQAVQVEDEDTTSCANDPVLLFVDYTPGYHYQWYSDDGAVGTDSSKYLVTNLGTYTYYVNILNEHGCENLSANTKTVLLNSLPTIPNITTSGNACDSIKLSVPNNTDYTYQWLKDGFDIENATDTCFYVTEVETANYALRISNANECSKQSENIVVTVKPKAPQLIIEAASETEFCNGGVVELSVPYNSEYTYNWLRNGGTIEQHDNTYLASDDGTYMVEVNNSYKCPTVSQNSVQVVINDSPDKPIVSLSRTPEFCEGDSVILSIDEQIGVSYQWINGNTEITDANTNKYVAYESGNYFVEVENTLSHCLNSSDSTYIEVTAMPDQPTVSADGYNINDCPQEKIITLTVDNISNEYTYRWYLNGKIKEGETESVLSDYLEEGTYSIEVINGECINESNAIDILYNPELPDKPEVIAKGPNVWYLACTNENALQYEWYFESELISGANEYIYVANQNMGTYVVKIAEENGCFVASDAVTIPLTTTGLDELNPFANLKIYPNPTPGVFTIEMDNNLFGELITRIFSQNAVEIFNIKFDKSTRHFKAQVDLSGQGKGLYIISFILDKYKTEKKLVVE